MYLHGNLRELAIFSMLKLRMLPSALRHDGQHVSLGRQFEHTMWPDWHCRIGGRANSKQTGHSNRLKSSWNGFDKFDMTNEFNELFVAFWPLEKCWCCCCCCWSWNWLLLGMGFTEWMGWVTFVLHDEDEDAAEGLMRCVEHCWALAMPIWWGWLVLVMWVMWCGWCWDRRWWCCCCWCCCCWDEWFGWWSRASRDLN